MTFAQDTPAVLVVDDDAALCVTIAQALKPLKISVSTCGRGDDAIALFQNRHFDLVLVDQRLPDVLGLDLVRQLQAADAGFDFVIISGYMTTALTVDAMKLGAYTVVDKPLRTNTLTATVKSALAAHAGGSVHGASRGRPRSSPERWAMHLLNACDAPGDLKTLDDWASFVGVSYSSLCESCRLVDIRPHDARDFLRILRALKTARRHDCAPEALLDVSDRRTLDTLLSRAGLVRGAVAATSLLAFLDRQQFIRADNEGLRVLRRLLAADAADAAADEGPNTGAAQPRPRSVRWSRYST
jgi:ActR/RegA family two-component response regulator